jgi:hypothetical protein
LCSQGIIAYFFELGATMKRFIKLVFASAGLLIATGFLNVPAVDSPTGFTAVSNVEAQSAYGGAVAKCSLDGGTATVCCGSAIGTYSNVSGVKGVLGDGTYWGLCDANYPTGCKALAVKGCNSGAS